MNTLKLHQPVVTLVDQVEDNLLTCFKNNNLRVGGTIPNELELAASLGVARSVLREALSRLKMMGMIVTHTRCGMILTELSLLGGMKRIIDPCILSEHALFDILGFRIALEIDRCSDLFAPELPFYYYNMPSMTGVLLSVSQFLVGEKKVIPNRVGTKFTHNN